MQKKMCSCIVEMVFDLLIFFGPSLLIKDFTFGISCVLSFLTLITGILFANKVYSGNHDNDPKVIKYKKEFDLWKDYNNDAINYGIVLLIGVNILRLCVLRFAPFWIALLCLIFSIFANVAAIYGIYGIYATNKIRETID